MKIGDVALQSGLPPKTIRFYEDIGLIRPRRSDNGYRSFCEQDLHTLMALYEDDHRESAQVKAVSEEQLRQIDEKIAQLQFMRATLDTLIHACAGDHRPDCPILQDLVRDISDPAM